MEFDMVANKEVAKLADMVAGQWSRGLVNWAKTFSTRTLPTDLRFLSFASLFLQKLRFIS